MSTHNLCFGKKVYLYKPQFCFIKVGYDGVYISWTCLLDALLIHRIIHSVEVVQEDNFLDKYNPL